MDNRRAAAVVGSGCPRRDRRDDPARLDRSRAFRYTATMAFKAVAFDVDGTLYPSAALYVRAWPIALRHIKLAQAFNKTRRAVRSAATTEACRSSGAACGAELRRLQAAVTAERLGWSVEHTAALIDEALYVRLAECFAGIRPYRGLVEALRRLRAEGLRTAVLSDFPPRRKLELMKMGDSFEIALCSEDSGFLKPAPEPFAMLCSALNLKAAEILYVGNSARYDLVGAKAAGMPVAMLSRRPIAGADISFSDWQKLVDFALGRR